MAEPETLRTDAVKAKEARDTLRPLLEQVCEALNAAHRDGLIASFNCARDQYGIYRVVALDIIKPL